MPVSFMSDLKATNGGLLPNFLPPVAALNILSAGHFSIYGTMGWGWFNTIDYGNETVLLSGVMTSHVDTKGWPWP